MNKEFQKFTLLWSGELISTIGSGLTAFGLGIYVLEKTGSATWMSIITLIGFLPAILLAAPAGVLADRYDRRLLMILGDSLSAIGLVYILICMCFGEAQIWQICIGVTISSVFSSLLEPSYKATITDLLDKDQYTKASGLVQAAGSARYLISPALAGYILKVADIKWILCLDIATFFITVLATLVVKKGLHTQKREQQPSFRDSFKEGFQALWKNKGVFILVIMGSVLCFLLGFIQILSMPMILAFSNSATVGIIESISACGMLVSSILVGVLAIKKGQAKILSISLALNGIFMMLFAAWENSVLICIFGFCFFATLPFANSMIDYLIRVNVENSVQGRAWGFVGIISQMGYVISYASSGALAEYVFTPLLRENGAFAESIGRIIGVGEGRGTALLIIVAGAILTVTAMILYSFKSVRRLELGLRKGAIND